MTNGISANETLVWRLQFAYKNPHREHLLMEAADEIERLLADRDRYRALAEHLCQNAPSIIVPDEIACLFPDPLLVRDASTN